MIKGIAFVKERGPDYMHLYGRRLVDAATFVLIGHLLLDQAAANDRKRIVARRFIKSGLPTLRRDIALLCSGDTSVITDYATLAGPVPIAQWPSTRFPSRIPQVDWT